ncbi:unnamed protein product, partial [Staurois parvus]
MGTGGHRWVALVGTCGWAKVGDTAGHRWAELVGGTAGHRRVHCWAQVGGTDGHRWVALMGTGGWHCWAQVGTLLGTGG